MIIVLLLYLHFQNVIEVLIVLLSIPFALVGSVWLMWLLDYRVSTAVWIGVIALLGVDAQTGVFMLLYLDLAYAAARQSACLRSVADLRQVVLDGAAKRIRPKLVAIPD